MNLDLAFNNVKSHKYKTSSLCAMIRGLILWSVTPVEPWIWAQGAPAPAEEEEVAAALSMAAAAGKTVPVPEQVAVAAKPELPSRYPVHAQPRILAASGFARRL